MWKKSPSSEKIRELSWPERIQMIKDTFLDFIASNSLFHGAALSYYTIFAMVPIIYLSVSVFGYFIGQKTMISIIIHVLKNQVGITDVSGIIAFLNTVNFEKGNFVLKVVGIVALLLSSSAIFESLRNSLNSFFGLEKIFHTSRKKILSNLLSRLISIALLGFAASVVIITYFAQLLLVTFLKKLFGDLEGAEAVFLSILQHGLGIFSNLLIFGFVFKYLHDGVLRWRLAWRGAFVTAILLYVGQLLIQYYLSHFFFAKDGGIAGVLLLILAYIYYSSQMIFFGAKFTAVYARAVGHPIVVKTSKRKEMKADVIADY